VVGTRAANRFGAAPVVTGSAIGLAGAVLVLTTPAPLTVTALALLAVGWFTGFPFGVVLALIARIVEAPGSQAQGPIAGAINGFAFLGAVVAPPLVGFVYDATDSWSIAFASLLIGPAVALAASRTLTQKGRTTSWASSTARSR
jgi:cyanate permease